MVPFGLEPKYGIERHVPKLRDGAVEKTLGIGKEFGYICEWSLGRPFEPGEIIP